jgi:hypothetical protein
LHAVERIRADAVRVLVCAATILLTSAGCRSSAADVARFDGLKLMATLPRTELRVGEELQVTLTMLNTSQHAISACLGQGKGFHIFGTTSDRGALETVDHESCVLPLRLRSGESMSWSRPISVGDVGIGAARLSMFVAVVSVEGFSRKYGAYSRRISTEFIPVQILPSEGAR